MSVLEIILLVATGIALSIWATILIVKAKKKKNKKDDDDEKLEL